MLKSPPYDFRTQPFPDHLRAEKVTLNHVCSHRFHITSQTGPLFCSASHDGRNEGLARKIPFNPSQKLKFSS